MCQMINDEFLISVVCVEDFTLSKNHCEVIVTCVEDDLDVNYALGFKDILYAKFRQEDPNDEFDVIDTTFQKLEEAENLAFMQSPKRKDYWVMEFESGLHHLVICFKEVKITKIDTKV